MIFDKQSNAQRKQRIQLLWKVILVGIIVLFGSQLRMTAVSDTHVFMPIRADAAEYVLYAYNMEHHGVYSRSNSIVQNDRKPAPDAVRAPGYPLFLILFIDRITPSEVTDVLITQALLSTVVILFTFILCARLMPWGWALIPTFLTAISPHLINSNVYVLTESLYTFCLATTFLALIPAYRSQRPWWWLCVGALFGACALVRPGIQYFPLILAGFLIISLPRKRALAASAAVIAGFACLFGPWVMRNLLVLGRPSDPQLMINFLHHGMYPEFMYQNNPQTLGYAYRFNPHAAAVSQSVGTVLAAIWNRFQNQPLEYLRWYLWGKPLYFWSWELIAGPGGTFVYPVTASPYFNNLYFKLTHAIARTTYMPCVILAAVSSVTIWLPGMRNVFERQSLLIIRTVALLLIYFTAIHMVGAPYPRYSVPLKPLMYLMSGTGLWFAWHLVRGGYRRIKPLPVGQQG